MYLTGVTLTTIGYGDIVASTGPGKAWAACLMMCGIGAYGRAFGQTWSSAKEKLPAVSAGLNSLLVNLTCTVVCGGLVMSGLEDWSVTDGLYWGVVTSTSAGYGDFVPVTDNGKIFTTLYALWALGSMAEVTGYLNGKLDTLVTGALGKTKKA